MTHTPEATIVIPAYNVAATIGETLDSALAQTHPAFEVVVIDDGATDETPTILAARQDPRLRVIRQPNRGLAGARNSGVAAARGRFIGFLDGDDLWAPEKLAAHIAHLKRSPELGVSFSASALIDAAGRPLGILQAPRLSGLTAADILQRNPIGNGSAPVIRREVFDAIAFRPAGERARDWWFDESFRQSEDIECWMRIALTTPWRIGGLAEPLTRYRVNPGGLSANLDPQFASWERMIDKIAAEWPDFIRRHGPAARAYQRRYLARRAVASRNGAEAWRQIRAGFAASAAPLWREPRKTLTTLLAAAALRVLGQAPYALCERAALAVLRLQP